MSLLPNRRQAKPRRGDQLLLSLWYNERGQPTWSRVMKLKIPSKSWISSRSGRPLQPAQAVGLSRSFWARISAWCSSLQLTMRSAALTGAGM